MGPAGAGVRPPSIDSTCHEGEGGGAAFSQEAPSRVHCTVVASMSTFVFFAVPPFSPSQAPVVSCVFVRIYPSMYFQSPYPSHELERMERTACGDEDTRASAGVFSSFYSLWSYIYHTPHSMSFTREQGVPKS